MEIVAPTTCPECASVIVSVVDAKSKIETLYCENTECPGRVRDMLTYIADRKLLEIDGLGEEMARLLTTEKYVVVLSDLFLFCKEIMTGLEKFGEPTMHNRLSTKDLPAAAIIKMAKSCEVAKTASWDRWLAALSIPMIGTQQSKVIVKTLGLGADDMRTLPASLLNAPLDEIEGIGPQKRATILDYANDTAFKALCAALYEYGVRPTPLVKPAVVSADAPCAGITFVITGELLDIGSREYITEQLVKLGAVSKTGVSKKVTHLITGDDPGSSKLKKAAELNLPHLDRAWVLKTFTENGVSVAKVNGKVNTDFLDDDLDGI